MEPYLAVKMHLPEGKRPGFYAQLVKGIAARVELFDRDKETLIVRNEQEAASIGDLMDHYNVAYEMLPLLLLPDSAVCAEGFAGIGFTSRFGNRYAYATLVRGLLLAPAADGASALPEQLAELLLVQIAPADGGGQSLYLVDAAQVDQARRAASEAGVTATLID